MGAAFAMFRSIRFLLAVLRPSVRHSVLAPFEFCTQGDDGTSTNRSEEEKIVRYSKSLLVAKWKARGDS